MPYSGEFSTTSAGLHVKIYTDAVAKSHDGTAVALGADGFAERLAERYELPVPGFPVSFRENPTQPHFGFEWCFGLDESQPVCNAVDMHVDADAMFIEGYRDDKVCGFAADAGQFAEFVDRVWNTPPELAVQHVGECLEMLRLDAEEPNRMEQLLKFREGNASQVFGAFNNLEELAHDLGRGFVPGAGAENGPDQNFEWGAGLRLNEFDDWRIVFLLLALEGLVYGGYVLDSHTFE